MALKTLEFKEKCTLDDYLSAGRTAFRPGPAAGACGSHFANVNYLASVFFPQCRGLSSTTQCPRSKEQSI